MVDARVDAGQCGGVRIDVADSYEAMSRRAARFIGQQVVVTPDLLLCAATGGSPTGTYAGLAALAATDEQRFAHLRVIKLDEWTGIAMDNAATCEHYVQQHVVGPLGIDADRYMAFQSDAAEPEAECRRVGRWLQQSGPIDLCILGLGANGHLALNEPGDSLQPFAHRATLAETSKEHAMLGAAGQPVTCGLTLGMADILGARRIVFLVSGSHKRELFSTFLQRRVSTRFPASLLWLHGDVRCFCDRDAFPG